MPEKPSTSSFTARDIGETINNAIVKARAPQTLGGPIPEKRFSLNLRPYSIALVEPVKDAVEKELLRPEEAVVALLSAALVIHMQLILGSEKLPMSSFAKQALEAQD